MTAAHELHGTIMNPKHVALSWLLVVGQIISPTGTGWDGLTAFYPSVSTHVSSESHFCTMETESPFHARHQKEGTAHRRDRYLGPGRQQKIRPEAVIGRIISVSFFFGINGRIFSSHHFPRVRVKVRLFFFFRALGQAVDVLLVALW